MIQSGQLAYLAYSSYVLLVAVGQIWDKKKLVRFMLQQFDEADHCT